MRLTESISLDSVTQAITGVAKNDIGIPGVAGFGVGVCPSEILPAGFTPLPNCSVPTHPNYGNYLYMDGSQMVWVPKFYYRIGDPRNATYAVFGANSIDIKGTSVFSTTQAANDAGYALRRMFIDGGKEQPGVMVDKFMASKNARGAGYIASSVKNRNPISTAADHNPIADLTACGGNNYYQAIDAAHARDGADGAINPDSIFFCCSRFIYAGLATLVLAHAQATAGETFCAWYLAGKAYPKGCNNNALADCDDSSVVYQSDGYSNCAKTGSGALFAKTTHNGQDCGIADLNGLMWEVSLGITCVATTKAVTAVTQANPCQLTVVAHGRQTGDYVQIDSVVGTTELNGKIYTVSVVDADNFTLDGVDSTGFGAYTSGGTATAGDFYVAKEAIGMKDFTSGATGVTDHWGAAGVSAMMQPIKPVFRTDYPNNGYSLRFGNGDNQVLSSDLSGDDWLLSGLGSPIAGGISAGGSALFGADYYYQYIRDQLCLISCAAWGSGSGAGVWYANWYGTRADSSSYVGFRAACYLV